MTNFVARVDPTDSALPHNQGQYSVAIHKAGEPLEILATTVLQSDSRSELEFYLRGKGFKIEKEIEPRRHYILVKADDR